MNKKAIILWIITVLCLVMTVVFWFLMNNYNPEYEEVKAIVTSATSKTLKNKKTGSNTATFYEVKARYNGKEYELKNVHGLAGYSEGKTVNAYFANGNLYANIEGITTTSPVGIVYFIFLFGTFIMIFVSSSYMSKNLTKSKKTDTQS